MEEFENHATSRTWEDSPHTLYQVIEVNEQGQEDGIAARTTPEGAEEAATRLKAVEPDKHFTVRICQLAGAIDGEPTYVSDVTERYPDEVEPEQSETEQPDEQEKGSRLGRFWKAVTGLNIATASLSVFNMVKLGVNPITQFQTAMEVVDVVLPFGYKRAAEEDGRQQHVKAAKVRSVTNAIHVGVAGISGAAAVNMVGQPAEFTPANVGLSLGIAALNLGIFEVFNRGDKKAAKENLATQPDVNALEDPSGAVHQAIARIENDHAKRRNRNNFKIYIMTNVVEALGVVAGEAAQLRWEYGASFATVAANAGIVAMLGSQIYQDQKSLRTYKNVEQNTVVSSAPMPAESL